MTSRNYQKSLSIFKSAGATKKVSFNRGQKLPLNQDEQTKLTGTDRLLKNHAEEGTKDSEYRNQRWQKPEKLNGLQENQTTSGMSQSKNLEVEQESARLGLLERASAAREKQKQQITSNLFERRSLDSNPLFQNDFQAKDFEFENNYNLFTEKSKPARDKTRLTQLKLQKAQNIESLNSKFYYKEKARKSILPKLRLPKIKLPRLSFLKFSFDYKSFSRKLATSAVLTILILVLLFLNTSKVYTFEMPELQDFNFNLMGSSQAAAPVKVNNIEEYLDNFDRNYVHWILAKNDGVFAYPEDDLDGDGLTNQEEFILQTDPLDPNTCDPEKTDSEVLLELKNPANCQPINLEDEAELDKFSQVFNIHNWIEDKQIAEGPNPQTPTESGGGIKEIFKVNSYTEINNIATENITELQQKLDKQKEYLRLINRIQTYVSRNRSFEPLDRDLPAPVHPAVYLDVALRYDVELKYVLAIAQLESRFGTDRYTASGNLTRPGQYKNIYSIGLDDSGNNLGFTTWEDGVEAFGKWYQRFDKRGVNDCQKWRIYNPNGDYCQKVETQANRIQVFLDS